MKEYKTNFRFLRMSAALILLCVSCFRIQAQIITTIAGTGVAGYTGDGGPAIAAEIDLVQASIRFYAGNLYITDQINQVIRKVDPFTGIITTIVGDNIAGYSGDGGPAIAAKINDATYLDFDQAGNMYFSDNGNSCIRKVSPSGIISTFAGIGLSYGYSGDGGAAILAQMSDPMGLAVDNAGNVYFCDNSNFCVRKINTSGVISTIAGTGTMGFSGDGFAATAAKLGYTSGLCIDAAGNIYFSDAGNSRIRKVSGGIITTIAGNGTAGYLGDGGPATHAELDRVNGITVDNTHNLLYLAQAPNNVIRCINLSSDTITTVAGTDTSGYSGDGGLAIHAKLFTPYSVDADCSGNIYIADYNNHRVRYVNYYYNHPPKFASGSHASFSICENDTAAINSFLGISDTDAGQNEWWVAYAPPAHGTLGGFDATATAPTGLGVVIPTGLTYASTSGYHGVDTFKVGIADCAGGTAIITLFVTVNALPAPITGTKNVCIGITDTLSDTLTGGTWLSGNTAVATIGSVSGVVTGVTSGTAIVTYTLATGCTITDSITVNPSPSIITGTALTCVGHTTTLSDTSTGGTWLSGNPSVATVGSSTGIVTGVTAGTTPIYYTVTSTGCRTSIVVTVSGTPASITGTTNVCVGSTTPLSDATIGGTWTSGNIAIATVGPTTGIVTGVSASTVLISYTSLDGCGTVTTTITVNPLPATITGTTNVCVGSTITLSDGTSGGGWLSSSPSIASVGSTSGIVTGVSAGTATITYKLPTNCYVIKTITVNLLPGAITGYGSVCVGFTRTFSDTTAGGRWLSGSTAIATVGSTTGIVTGVSAGTTAITYGILSTGCYVTAPVTVVAIPAPITGITGICTDSPTHLYDATGTGIWSSSNTAIVTIGTSSGIVTTVSLGTAIITYTTAAGCYVTTTVSPLSISGLHNMCAWVDSLTAISVPGGSFSSSLVTVVNLGGGLGEVHANAPGTAAVTYMLPNGCFVTGTLTVNPLPGLITGTDWVCSGSTRTLSDTSVGGTWSSDSTSIATVGSTTGIVTGVSTGTVLITYTLPTGCWADTSVVVNPLPSAIGGNSFLCIGSMIGLTDGHSGGTWTSSNTAIATVGSTTGIVTGDTIGTDTITYTLCTHSVTIIVTVSPLLPITGATTLCVGSTTTLSDAVSGGRWYSGSTAIATIGSISGVVTGVSGGSVTITYVLATGCGITFAMQVNDTASCTPCSALGSYTPLGSSGHITSNVGPGNYYIGNNVTVTGTDTFTNAIILIAPYDTVFIDTSAMLTLDSTHMFSLCTEWQGMELKPGRTHSGRLFVTNHSLIEDAFCAVYIPNAVTPSSGLIFKSEASIFNRNAIGLFIQHYNPATPVYPFLVHNTVFTSRDLQTTNTHFPYQWPPTLGLGGLKNYWSPGDTFSTPINIDDTTPGLGYSYPAVYCYGDVLPTNGIRLDSVGSNNVAGRSGVPIPGRYYEVVVGDTTATSNNQNQNLFDALQFGIYSVNSNLTCINNVFADLFAHNVFSMYPTSMGGDGIYAAETDDYANQNRLRVYTPAGALYGNRFYNFNLGLECSNMFQVIGQHCYMMNKVFGTLFGPPAGTGGVYVKTAKYDTIDVSYDTITNVTTGISVWMAFDPTVRLSFGGTIVTIPSQFMGTCNLNYNLLQVHPDWTASLGSSQHMNLGISYQNPYTYIPAMDVSTVASSLTIAVNKIHDAYNGIYVNNYAAPSGFHAYTTTNWIYERQNGTGIPKRLQYGINHTDCFNSRIYYDSVTTGTVASVTGRGTDSMRAFYNAANTGMDIGCNEEVNLGRGYEFFLTNAGTNWHDNRITSNYKGLVLNGGGIGSQVNGGTTVASNTINDKWEGTWSGTDTQTYVISTNAHSSALYAGIGATTYPTVNGGRFLLLKYSPANGLDTAANLVPDCRDHWSAPYDTMSIYDLIAQQHVDYVYRLVSNNWMGQYALWKAAVLDSTIVDSSAVVAQFVHMADSMSRFKYITAIEYALSTGDIATANSLLGLNIDSMANTATDSATQVKLADDVSADNIVMNYQQFYSLYIKYETGTLVGADSLSVLALAQLCPEQNGAVVYQARALYSDIYNDLSVFNDDSCIDVDTSYIGERHTNHNVAAIDSGTIMQRYILYPNPNDGSFTLQQYVPDGEPVAATVLDAVGRVLYKETIEFASAKSCLNLGNYAPGIYLLELKDTKNRIFRFKFVISK